MSTETVMKSALVVTLPDGGASLAHGTSTDALQLSEPWPMLVTARDCGGGLTVPSNAVNDRPPMFRAI